MTFKEGDLVTVVGFPQTAEIVAIDGASARLLWGIADRHRIESVALLSSLRPAPTPTREES